MTNHEAREMKGKLVRVTGYRTPNERIGTVIGVEYWGRGNKAMYVRVDFGRPMPDHPDGVICYKPKHLREAVKKTLRWENISDGDRDIKYRSGCGRFTILRRLVGRRTSAAYVLYDGGDYVGFFNLEGAKVAAEKRAASDPTPGRPVAAQDAQ